MSVETVEVVGVLYPFAEGYGLSMASDGLGATFKLWYRDDLSDSVSIGLLRARNISHSIPPVHSSLGSGDTSVFIDAERSELELCEDTGMISPSFCKFDSGL